MHSRRGFVPCGPLRRALLPGPAPSVSSLSGSTCPRCLSSLHPLCIYQQTCSLIVCMGLVGASKLPGSALQRLREWLYELVPLFLRLLLMCHLQSHACMKLQYMSNTYWCSYACTCRLRAVCLWGTRARVVWQPRCQPRASPTSHGRRTGPCHRYLYSCLPPLMSSDNSAAHTTTSCACCPLSRDHWPLCLAPRQAPVDTPPPDRRRRACSQGQTAILGAECWRSASAQQGHAQAGPAGLR